MSWGNSIMNLCKNSLLSMKFLDIILMIERESRESHLYKVRQLAYRLQKGMEQNLHTILRQKNAIE